MPVGELKAQGHTVMGINRVIRDTPINIFHTQDTSSYLHDFQSIRGSGILAVVPSNATGLLGDVFMYNRGMIPQLGSGFTGLFLAAILGFDPIFLIGYDFHHNGTDKYYSQVHDGVGPFKERFDTEVFIATKGSKMTQFPYRSFDDCLNGDA